MSLRKGSQGPDVSRMQSLLGINADGDFGPATEAAVLKYQKDNGLKEDGVAGPMTLSKMGFFNGLPFDALKLRGHVPDGVIIQIPEVSKKFGIDSALKLAHFLAQCAHESGEFRTVFENLYYTSAGLKRIFPRYFPGDLSEKYQYKPEMIASRVYGSRMGNGDESTGEGYKFRGRGYIQLTGKENYKKFSTFIGEDCVADPDLVATKYPLASAAFFFNSNNLWKLCEAGATDKAVESVTLRVNGGYNGLADRQSHFRKYYSLLTK